MSKLPRVPGCQRLKSPLECVVMTTVALTAHFDGEKVQFDEPCQLDTNARLMVVVLPPDDERQAWSRFSAAQLAKASDLKMKGYTAWNIARFKSLNLSDFPWAGAGGSPGPPPARGADSAGGFRPPRSSSIPSLIVARVGTSTFFPVDTDAPVPGH